MLTEGAVRASDKRVRFIGEAYEAEGGSVLRDRLQGDDGGWPQDVALVDRLVAGRLACEAEMMRGGRFPVLSFMARASSQMAAWLLEDT